jgi:hypothetical protein
VAAQEWMGERRDKRGEEIRQRPGWRGGGEGACTDAGVKEIGGGGSGAEEQRRRPEEEEE